MKLLARLRQVRQLQEQVAEQKLLAARSSADAAMQKLISVDGNGAANHRSMMQGVAEGRFEPVYLSGLTQALDREARPRIKRIADWQEGLRQQAEATFLAARRDRSISETLLRTECKQERALLERREQKALDHAYGNRWRREHNPAAADHGRESQESENNVTVTE